MTIDFGKNPVVTPPVVLNNQVVEVVNQYKYLGILVDNKLTFEPQVDAVCKKVHQRMYFYRKLRNFYVDNTFMQMFYSCFIESVLTFTFICWYGSISIKNKNRLQGLTNICSKIAGLSLHHVNELYNIRTLKKVCAVLGDQSHPLFKEFTLLPSGRRYVVPRCRTNRLKNSFVPVATGLLNNFMK